MKQFSPFCKLQDFSHLHLHLHLVCSAFAISTAMNTALNPTGKKSRIKEKLPSKGQWYAPKCVTPGVTANGHSISISISISNADSASVINQSYIGQISVIYHPFYPLSSISTSFVHFIYLHPFSFIFIPFQPLSSTFIHCEGCPVSLLIVRSQRLS